ncbi:TRAP transporter substrate-binding protein [Rhodobacteraceae bacterium RKSG542]|uniref:TRAP transporter substrate-binding protein n=1 Tax=Pseudovibrio flavus TaxID=2529854 RepID=UPI0012BCF169|nr:TRAP transporter substrate-binding protein [Pseudovibrio flavus]MTI18140.1 TRAP transporter substrate-binding protein [Pseudovibrio flavus]
MKFGFQNLGKALATTVLVGCTFASGIAYSAEYTLRVAHGNNEQFHMHKAWEKFKEVVEAESKGEIAVEIYANGQMGEDRELLEFVQDGTIDLNASTVAVLAGWDTAFAASELPYMFPDRATALAALNGSYGEWLFKRAEEIGFKGLGWFETGFRNINNSVRPIYKPEDLDGIKIRTMQVDAHMAAFRHLGANPTPMAFGEVYSALQQGVVDAQENPLSAIVTSRLYEVAPFVSLTNHVYSTHIVVMNPDRFESLPENYQDLILRAVKEGEAHQQAIIAKEEQEMIAILEKEGGKVNALSPEEIKVFQDRISEISADLKGMVDPEAYEVLRKAVENKG